MHGTFLGKRKVAQRGRCGYPQKLENNQKWVSQRCRSDEYCYGWRERAGFGSGEEWEGW